MQRGGAERVALDLVRAFPGAKLYTTVLDTGTTFGDFASVDVVAAAGRPRWMRGFPQWLMAPLVLAVVPFVRVRDADVVVCSSAGWSHLVRFRGPKVVYCHTPARWLYVPEDYFSGRSATFIAVWKVLSAPLRVLDRRAMARAAAVVANSSAVRERIRRVYGRDADRVFPCAAELCEPEPRNRFGDPGYYLVVGRPKGYKNSSTAVDAFRAMPGRRLVIVGDRGEGVEPSPNVTFAGTVTDAELARLYADAKALISLSHEDFGLTPIEAHRFGTPSVLLRAGGFLDTGLEGVNTVFVTPDEPAHMPARLIEALDRFEQAPPAPEQVRESALRFTRETFASGMWEIVRRVVHGPSRREPVTAGRP